MQTYTLDPPESLYEKMLMQTLFSHYSPKTLHYKAPPELYTPDMSFKKLLWEIPHAPVKTLDAPELVDNFYYNNLDWSRIVVVNLNEKTLGYDPTNEKVTAFEKINETNDEVLSAIKCSPEGDCFARGSESSILDIIDIAREKKTRVLTSIDRFQAINSIDWKTCNELVVGVSGQIGFIDLRTRSDFSWVPTDPGAVCSLKWDPTKRYLAAGSNHNSVRILEPTASVTTPVRQYSHAAAVKAIQWNPKNPHLLMSGGGSADQILKVYDVAKGRVICQKSTGEQICSLSWLEPELAVIGLAKGMQYWKFENATLLKVDENAEEKGRILDIRKDPKSHQFCSLSSNETLSFWELKSLAQKSKVQPTRSILSGYVIR